MDIYLQGFVLLMGLIVTIGAQNVFLLKQGIQHNYAFTVATICLICDMVLFLIGILGLGAIIAQSPLISFLLALLGGCFLFSYGYRALKSAWQGNQQMHLDGVQPKLSKKRVILATLAVTLLNPHVYIDTVVILGGIGGTLNSEDKILFFLGCCTGSFLWFYSLAYFARKLAPLFKKARTWQILDCFVAVIMFAIAFSLFAYAYHTIEML